MATFAEKIKRDNTSTATKTTTSPEGPPPVQRSPGIRARTSFSGSEADGD
jgi:hypothetical protein